MGKLGAEVERYVEGYGDTHPNNVGIFRGRFELINEAIDVASKLAGKPIILDETGELTNEQFIIRRFTENLRGKLSTIALGIGDFKHYVEVITGILDVAAEFVGKPINLDEAETLNNKQVIARALLESGLRHFEYSQWDSGVDIIKGINAFMQAVILK